MRPNVRRSTLHQLTRLHERITAFDVTDRTRWRRSVELGVRLALAGEVELWTRWLDDLDVLFEIVAPDQAEPLGDTIGAVCAAADDAFAPVAVALGEHLAALDELWFARQVLEEVRFRLHLADGGLDELHRAAAGRTLGTVLARLGVEGTEPVDLLVESATVFEQHGFLVSAGGAWSEAATLLQGSDDEQSMEYLEEAELAFGRGGAVEGERTARLRRALLLDRSGHAAAALDVALATATGPSVTLRAMQLHAVAASYRSLGLYVQALAAAAEAEASYEQIGDTDAVRELARLRAGIAAEFGNQAELWFE